MATDAGQYDCVVSNACGSVASSAAALDVGAGCPSDLDDGTGTGTPDGGSDINDLLCFLGAFELGDLAADQDDGSGSGVPDGGADINELLYSLGHFEVGC